MNCEVAVEVGTGVLFTFSKSVAKDALSAQEERGRLNTITAHKSIMLIILVLIERTSF